MNLKKILGLGLSFPSTIFVAAAFLFHLEKRGVMERWQAICLFLAIVLNTLFLMVYYAYRKKN